MDSLEHYINILKFNISLRDIYNSGAICPRHSELLDEWHFKSGRVIATKHCSWLLVYLNNLLQMRATNCCVA